MAKIKKRINSFIKNFRRVITRPEMIILPGQLAYFFVLAIIPTITIVSMIATILNLSTDVIHNFLSGAFNSGLADIILAGNDSSFSSISTTIIIIIAYIVSSNGASSIIVTSNTIYGIENDSYIQRKIKALIMIILIIFLLVIMLVIPMFGTKIIELLTEVYNDTGSTGRIIAIIQLLQGPLLWFILFIFIKLIYIMAPDKKIKSNTVNYGAFFTSIGWFLVTYIYSYYVNTFADYSVLYGNLANLIVLMLWFYFLSYIFTIGMALNYHKEEIQKDK